MLFRKADLDALYRDHPRFERLGRILTEEALLAIHRRNQMLTLETPRLRYERLREEFPLLIQGIPQYVLASSFNIRPESLSRLRRPQRS